MNGPTLGCPRLHFLARSEMAGGVVSIFFKKWVAVRPSRPKCKEVGGFLADRGHQLKDVKTSDYYFKVTLHLRMEKLFGI